MAQSGTDIIDVDWMVPLKTARELAGAEVTLCGNINPAGVLFKGSKGFLVSSFDNRIVIPYGDDADMTYYNPPSKENVIF